VLDVGRGTGSITAAVWDVYSSLPACRIIRDTAGVLDPEAKVPHAIFPPVSPLGEMETLWREAALAAIRHEDLAVHMAYAGFDDYWTPFEAGDGPPGQYTS
jgi:hypothetical protein